MLTTCPIPDLSPEDRTTLLALIDPVHRGAGFLARGTPGPSLTDDSTVPDPDPLTAAHFLSRPDIRPHLEALRALFAFRQEIERQHRTDQLVDALLEIAKTSPDLTERRLAATTALRALYPPSNRARSASEGPTPHRPTSPTPQRGGGQVHAQREPGGGASTPITPHPTAAPKVSGGRAFLPAAPTVDPSADTPAANHQSIHTLPLQPTYGPVLLTLTDDHPLHSYTPPTDDTS